MSNVKKHIMLISSSIKNLNDDLHRRPCRPPQDTTNSSRPQARRQPKQPMLPTAPRSGRGFANEKEMLANCHPKAPILHQMPSLALPNKTTYQVLPDSFASDELSNDPRVRSVLNSKNCAVVISTESSPAKEAELNAGHMMSLTELISKGSCSSEYSGGQTFRTRDHNSSKTTARGQQEPKQMSWFLSIRGIKDNPQFDGSPQFGGRMNAQTAPVSPLHSAETTPKQNDGCGNQRYIMNEPAQSSIFQLDQDTPVAPIEASFCDQSSHLENSKFLLNESIISEFEKLNEDSTILNESDILKQVINKNSIIQYEEVKETTPRQPHKPQRQNKPKPRTFETKLKAPTPVVKTPKRSAKQQRESQKNEEPKRPSIRAPTKVGKPRTQGHMRSKSDFIGQLKPEKGGLSNKTVARPVKNTVAMKQESRKLYTPSRRKNMTPKRRTQDSAISEKENSQLTSPLKRSEKKVLGSVVNTLFSNTLKSKSKSKTDLQETERSMSPLGFKPQFGRTQTVASNQAPPQKLQLHYCL